MKKIDKKQDWGLAEVWNKALESRKERATKPRNRIWASELGRQDIDVYLKMIGEEPSNPFGVRALRKFEAGNVFEWIVELILKRADIYKDSQEWLGNDDFGVTVSGKLDFIAGGTPNYENAVNNLAELELPDIFTKATENVLDYFQKEYPEGLDDKVFEIKSTSSYGIEKVYETKKPLAGHDLQLFHYVYCKQLPGTIVYFSKDDLRMAEIDVWPDDKDLLERYKNKIEGIAKAYRGKKEPEKEPEIVFEDGKFTRNFNVEYSAYLKRNYGYEKPGDYADKWGSVVSSWNRVITRVKNDRDMTDNNKEKIEQMKKMGFDIYKLIKT